MKYTAKSDDAYDKKHGIKENSKKDIALDKKRGISDDSRPPMQQSGHPEHNMPAPEHDGHKLPLSTKNNKGFDE